MKTTMCLVSLCLVLILSGCGTLTEQYGFDKDGKVISYEKINADIIGSVMQSTKEKNVLIIDRGWAFGLVLSPGTPDDPTAHFKIVCGKFFRVWFSVIKDVTKDALEGMAKVIEAADAPLTASTGGVSEGANAK